jgi:probable rRNA maturation factor
VNHKLSLAVQYACGSQCLPTRAQFRRWFKVALQHSISITLRIVDEPEGRELNRNYRGKDYATNVLTFVYDDAEPQPLPTSPCQGRGKSAPLTSGAGGVTLYGDIVICAPVVAREAAAQHKDLLAHYAHLAIHAALHLQGYEHDSDADAAGMETLETALMLKLHYPDPYQAS